MSLITSILTGGINNHPTTSEEANFIGTDFFTAGVVGTITNTSSVAPMTGAYAVNAQGTPDMTVAVTAGAAYVTATPAGQNSQRLRVRLTANQNVTISANSSGSTKYDWLYIKVDPTVANAPNLAGDDVATLVTSRSTSNSTDNGTPPTYGTAIAVITVANGATSITNSVIRDVRAASSLNIVSATDGWQTGVLAAPSTITNNGNRSYTLTHASSIASTVSAGMRRRFTRTVAANTYMGGAFNGSSHYFTKVTPTGTLSTVTNNFTIEAWVQPTSYALSWICGRSDATPANALGLQMTASGQVGLAVYSGGAANFRVITTYQSLPLNKKTHVAASWTGGTVVIYFDGVSVPVATASTGGTAPTTAGTGGDFSIGRLGSYASSYFAGHISNVAVFDAVLTQATIRQHMTIKHLGSETNCIGAWSLDNVATDAFGVNNLTATGGVSYTSGMSPFGNSGTSSTLEYALTMSVSSDGLTEVVQVPEGCALPTSGGITASAYSTQANPYGWVSDKGRWEIRSVHYGGTSYTGTSYAQYLGRQISPPIGSFELYVSALIVCQASGAGATAEVTLSTTTSTVTDFDLYTYNATVTTNNHNLDWTVTKTFNFSAATTYYVLAKVVGAGALVQVGVNRPLIMTLTPSNL